MSNMEPNGRVTLREVYELVEKLETKMDRKLQHIEDQFDVRLISHQQEHEASRRERISQFRWTVGSFLGIATLIATVVSFLK